jgi:FkbM family methyltransferase
MFSQSARRWLLAHVPARFELPLRYGYSFLTHRIEAELTFVSTLLSSRNLFVDVGAHYGIWSYHLSKPFNHVVAFEPQHQCARVIKATALPNVVIHECALSSVEGILPLTVPHIQGQQQRGLATLEQRRLPSGTSISVPVCTLDSFNLTDIDLIKIDVEGHEDAVLAGATKTLERSHPILVVEIEARHRNKPPSAAVEFMMNVGYQGFILHPDDGLKPVEQYPWEKIQDVRNIGTKYYISNVIFVPIGKLSTHSSNGLYSPVKIMWRDLFRSR